MSALDRHDPDLHFAQFPFFPWHAITLNLGEISCCKRHRDHLNLVYGICLDIAFGDFDFRTGGHLVLHELRCIVEMRPGQAVLFPSSSVTHENIPLVQVQNRAPQFRYSKTTYTAAANARYVHLGYQTLTAITKKHGKSVQETYEAEGHERWMTMWAKSAERTPQEYWKQKTLPSTL